MKLKFDRLSRQAIATTARSVGLVLASALALTAGVAEAAATYPLHYIYFTSPNHIGYSVKYTIYKWEGQVIKSSTITMNGGGKSQIAYGKDESVEFTAKRSKYSYSNYWLYNWDGPDRVTARCITIQPWSVQYVADNTRGCKR